MALRNTGKPALPTAPKVEYSAAEIGALARLGFALPCGARRPPTARLGVF